MRFEWAGLPGVGTLAVALLGTLVEGLSVGAQGSVIEMPFGFHGPTYSHLHGEPDVWKRGQMHFDAFHQLGVDWARMDVWWGLIEPTQGLFDWEHFDRAIASYAENGVNLTVILCYGPAWRDSEAPVDEETREAFGNYVYETVRRYRRTVKEWEIWNEPNILPYWSPQPNVADYAALLQVAHRQAKRADPDCVVIGGATAGADLDFVRGLFENGAGDSFDVLSYHSYTGHPTREAVEAEVRGLRETLDAYGRTDVPIWLTEHGLSTGWGGVTEGTQARDIVRMMCWRTNAGVERSMYLSLRDWGPADDEAAADNLWGVLTHDGQAKPSWHAVRTMGEAIAGRPFAGELHLGPDVESFLFGGLHDNSVAIWTTEGGGSEGPVEFSLNAGVAHLVTESLLGEERLLTSEDHNHVLWLDSDPSWLHHVGANLVLLAGVETTSPTLARGDDEDMEITVRNPLGQPLAIEVSLGEVEGLGVEGLPMEFLLTPGTDAALPVTVSASADAPVGEHILPLQVAAQGTSMPIAAVVHHASVRVTDPFTVAMSPAARLDERGRLPVSFELVNHARRDLDVGVTYSSGALAWDGGTHRIRDRALVSLPLVIETFSSGEPIPLTAEFEAQGHVEVLDEQLRLLPIPHLSQEVAVDGDLSEWESEPTLRPEQFTEVAVESADRGGPEDIAARGWLAWSDTGLWIALEITDDQIDPPTDLTTGEGDRLRIAFDPLHDARRGEAHGPDDIELAIALLESGNTALRAIQYPAGRSSAEASERSVAAITATGENLRCEVFLPAETLSPMRFEPGALVGFNLIQTDSDGAGRESWLELAPGLGENKEPASFPTAILLP